MAIKRFKNLDRTGMLIVGKSNGETPTYSLPDPASMSIGIQDLDNEEGTGRNANGTYQRDRVATKIKLTIQWTPMNSDDMKDILTSAIKNPFFKCKFFNPYIGGMDTKTMYVGDRTIPVLVKLANGDYAFKSLSANFIER